MYHWAIRKMMRSKIKITFLTQCSYELFFVQKNGTLSLINRQQWEKADWSTVCVFHLEAHIWIVWHGYLKGSRKKFGAWFLLAVIKNN